MIHTYAFHGVPVATGDVICTVDGTDDNWYGKLWKQAGRLLPGKVDHCAIYIGPEGRFVEAGPAGVMELEMTDGKWDAMLFAKQRLFVDSFYGVAYPLANRGFSPDVEATIRKGIADYCLKQVQEKKRYNYNFPNSSTENSFYCSQLVYSAYLNYGIDLNCDQGIPSVGPLSRIVFPEEIWNACAGCRLEADKNF